MLVVRFDVYVVICLRPAADWFDFRRAERRTCSRHPFGLNKNIGESGSHFSCFHLNVMNEMNFKNALYFISCCMAPDIM